jgi:hypothetical protein
MSLPAGVQFVGCDFIPNQPPSTDEEPFLWPVCRDGCWVSEYSIFLSKNRTIKEVRLPDLALASETELVDLILAAADFTETTA